jgi:hypothetical protein
MTPWRKLIRVIHPLAAKVRSMRPPKIRVVADGRVLYWALAVPTEEDLAAHATFPGQSSPSLEGWLAERLRTLEEDWPDAREVELLGVWAGNPPRLERIARAWVEDGEVAHA